MCYHQRGSILLPCTRSESLKFKFWNNHREKWEPISQFLNVFFKCFACLESKWWKRQFLKLKTWEKYNLGNNDLVWLSSPQFQEILTFSEHVCGQPRDMGNKCRDDGIGSKPTITRYYFDTATGSCRSFEFSRCGGNANNFDTLEQCEGFCLDNQCPKGNFLALNK